MNPIELILPYPVSANRYWRSMAMNGSVRTYPSKDAKEYKAAVAAIVQSAGIRSPMIGRVALTVSLYPSLPQDARTRMRKHGAAWDDTVLCLDLDNALKVLIDCIKGVVIDDDRWVRRIVAERFEPVGEPHVRLRVEPFVTDTPQLTIEAAGAALAVRDQAKAFDDWTDNPFAVVKR